MKGCTAGDPQISTGHRLDQLASAFSRVQDHRDWKAPIRAVIQADQRSVVELAIRWFTNTVPDFVPAPNGDGQLIVVSAGYRLGPAGDPAEGGVA